ncbi:DedA protein [Salmonella enterica subsp. enterica]|nr:DedA protein [Salmonella enterica subsp. enterica]
MDLIYFIIDFILHIDVHLAELVAEYGVWVYAILFLILFCETGLVVTPFLPGDSLLFVAGALGFAGNQRSQCACHGGVNADRRNCRRCGKLHDWSTVRRKTVQ